MKLQTVVLGFDGSADAREALKTVIELAGDGTVVHVVTAYRYPSDRETAELMATLPEEFLTNYDRLSAPRGHLDDAAKTLERAGIDHEGHLIEGDAASAILDVIDSTDADLVVVGSRGVGRIARFMRGSVSSRVASHAPCNFLVVHAEGEHEA